MNQVTRDADTAASSADADQKIEDTALALVPLVNKAQRIGTPEDKLREPLAQLNLSVTKLLNPRSGRLRGILAAQSNVKTIQDTTQLLGLPKAGGDGVFSDEARNASQAFLRTINLAKTLNIAISSDDNDLAGQAKRISPNQ